MKKRSLILATAALAILSIVPVAWAEHMRRGPGHRGPGGLGAIMMLGHLEHAKDVLGLSDQQVTDIKAIFKDLHEQNATLHEQLRAGTKAVAEKLIANPNDVAGAQAELAKQEAAEHAMKVNALNAASKALNVLTAEQRAKLGEKLAEHGAKRMRRQR